MCQRSIDQERHTSMYIAIETKSEGFRAEETGTCQLRGIIIDYRYTRYTPIDEVSHYYIHNIMCTRHIIPTFRREPKRDALYWT